MRKTFIGCVAATAVVAAAAMPAIAQRDTGTRGGTQAQEPIGFPYGANLPGKSGGGPGTETKGEGGAKKGGERAKGGARGGARAGEGTASTGESRGLLDWRGGPFGGPAFLEPGFFAFGGQARGGPYAAYAGPSCEVARVRRALPNGRVVWRMAQICY
jgi:hypothetical protein